MCFSCRTTSKPVTIVGRLADMARYTVGSVAARSFIQPRRQPRVGAHGACMTAASLPSAAEARLAAVYPAAVPSHQEIRRNDGSGGRACLSAGASWHGCRVPWRLIRSSAQPQSIATRKAADAQRLAAIVMVVDETVICDAGWCALRVCLFHPCIPGPGPHSRSLSRTTHGCCPRTLHNPHRMHIARGLTPLLACAADRGGETSM